MVMSEQNKALQFQKNFDLLVSTLQSYSEAELEKIIFPLHYVKDFDKSKSQ